MDTSKLKPANENPWYVLTTLYGEQEGEIDEGLHKRNQDAWHDLGYSPYRDSIPDEWRGVARLKNSPSGNGAELVERFRKRSWQPDLKRPESAAKVAFHGVVFDRPLKLSGFAFQSHVTFEGCVFVQAVDLDQCLFNQGVTFKNVEFRKGLTFKNGGSRGAANLQFLEVGGHLLCRGTRFGASFNLRGFSNASAAVSNNSVSFKEARFDGLVNFSDQTFSGYTVFENALFEARSFFSRSEFQAGVTFRGAVFDDYAYFQGTQFRADAGSEHHHINFTESRFERPPTFRNAKFVGEFPNLGGAILHDRSVFTAHEADWPKAKDLFERDEKSSVTSAKVAAESAATLRAFCARQSLPEEEHFFFRREMHFEARSASWAQNGLYFVFEWASDYGRSIARPANLLLALWLLGAFVCFEATHLGIFEALGYSFANMFKFFGLHRTYFDFDVIRNWPGWLQWFSGAQTVLAFILLFFLGLGLRTRFRLR